MGRVLLEAIRARRRDLRMTLAFAGVLALALTVTVAAASLAWPLVGAPLPFPNAADLVAIRASVKGAPAGVSWGDADSLRARVPSIRALAVYTTRTWGVQVGPDGHVDVMRALMTTGELFDVLGLRPATGRSMTRGHDAVGAQQDAWLANATAVRLFGGADTAVARTILLNGTPYRVAGVLPASFRFPVAAGTPDLIIPLPRGDYCCERGAGATRALALAGDRDGLAAELRTASLALAHDFPATNTDRTFVAASLRDELFGPRLAAVRWMLIGTLFLTGIAAANGAGIWMTRWLRARRHLAIHLSLGASRRRLAAVRAVEGALAGLLAGAAAVIGASLLLDVLRRLPFLEARLDAFAVWHPLALEPVVAIVAVAAAVCLGLAAALLPHLVVMSRRATGTTRAATPPRRARHVRLVLTTIQLAGTAMLGWTAIAIGENAYALLTADRGFETAHLLVAGIGIPEARYDTDERMTAFHTAAIASLGTIPGVTGVAGGVGLPTGTLDTRILLDGQTLAREEQPRVRIGVASPDLLPLLGIPVVLGRGFTIADRLDAPRVALVNDAFVRRYLADARDPLREGLRLSFYNGFAMKPYKRFQIVGVTADTRNDPLLAGTEPAVLIPAAQIAMEGFFYFVKTTRPAAAVEAELRQAIWRVDPAVQRVHFRNLDDFVEQGLADRRALGGFGLATLLLAGLIVATGLFASLSAGLVESAREMAVRAAVGATPARLVCHALGWALAAAGLAAAATAAAVPFIASRVPLEGTVLRPTTASVGLCLLAMTAITAAAALGPARRAATMSPIDVLREE